MSIHSPVSQPLGPYDILSPPASALPYQKFKFQLRHFVPVWYYSQHPSEAYSVTSARDSVRPVIMYSLGSFVRACPLYTGKVEMRGITVIENAAELFLTSGGFFRYRNLAKTDVDTSLHFRRLHKIVGLSLEICEISACVSGDTLKYCPTILIRILW